MEAGGQEGGVETRDAHQGGLVSIYSTPPSDPGSRSYDCGLICQSDNGQHEQKLWKSS